MVDAGEGIGKGGDVQMAGRFAGEELAHFGTKGFVGVLLFGGGGDEAATAQGRVQDVEGDQLGGFANVGFLEGFVPPPAHTGHVVRVEADGSGAGSDAAVAANEVLLDAALEIVGDADVGDVAAVVLAAVEGVDGGVGWKVGDGVDDFVMS